MNISSIASVSILIFSMVTLLSWTMTAPGAAADPTASGVGCEMTFKIINGGDRWGCPSEGCTGTTICTRTNLPGGVAVCTCGEGGPQPWCCHLVVQTGMPDMPVGAGLCDLFFCLDPGVCTVAFDETGDPSPGDGEWFAICEL